MKIIYTKYDWGNENKRYYFYAIDNDSIIGQGQVYYCETLFGLKIFHLSEMNVIEEYRKRGIALQLQEAREKLAKELEGDYIRIWVNKDSWMEKWYERRGYKFYAEMDIKQNWMYKKL